MFTMKQNEFFIFPTDSFNPQEIDLKNPNNYYLISPNIFRVQKIATKNYMFRHHLETTKSDRAELKNITFKQYKTLTEFNKIVKVRINHLGRIVSIGEENNSE